MNSQLDSLKFEKHTDTKGNNVEIIPTIIQDHSTGQVLVLCYMIREALEKTIDTGKIHMYSRSRGRVALKGESSGHFQLVKDVLTDCDKDTVIFKVEQHSAACHEGYYSCFYRQYNPAGSDWKVIGQKVFDPETVYKK
jgi:phosphoribosyl-AMP cyclohydrolase